MADEDAVVDESELDNVVLMHDKEFAIGPPDGLIVLRTLRILSRVIQRAEAEAKTIGLEIFKQVAKEAAEGEETPAGPMGLSDDLLQKILVFVSILEDQDLLKLGSALLQFKDESYGVRWLKKHGVKLAPLMKALVLNLRQLDDVVEALRVFMPTLTGLRMMTSLSTAAKAAQDGPKPSDSSES